MFLRKIVLIGVCALILAACGNNDEKASSNTGSTKDSDYTSQNNAINHGISDTKQNTETNEQAAKSYVSSDDEGVGFELNSDGKVDEDQTAPAEEKKAILAVFDEYIAAFNDKDIDRYAKTIADKPQGFDYKEEIDYTKQAFKDYDVKRTAKNITLKKYKDNYAEIFANIKTVVKQDSNSFTQPLNQVTVMTKDNGKWGVSAVYVMGTKK